MKELPDEMNIDKISEINEDSRGKTPSNIGELTENLSNLQQNASDNRLIA